MIKRISLEKEALEVCIENSKPPFIFQLPPEEGRKVLDKAQDTPIEMYPSSIFTTEVNTGRYGKIPVNFIVPESCEEKRHVILYIHGAGWVFGNLHTHEKLVRELAARTGSIVVFPEYSRSPEVHYPVALEQCYFVLCCLGELLERMELSTDLNKLVIAGDSAGGNIATALTIMAKFRQGPCINRQLLYYPVTNACFDTSSYKEFGIGYYLYRAGMEWFWNQYLPDCKMRNQITASPLNATVEQLQGLPAAMILNGEADVLRDEGEAYARKLRSAGVPVTAIRFQAMIHDFVMLNALDQTKACRAAMDVSTDWIKKSYCE